MLKYLLTGALPLSYPFMFRGVLSFLLLGVVATSSGAAEPPGEVYLNRTSVVNPMVNHRHFINEGEFTAFGFLPWDGQNIVTFTNRSLMAGAPGFRFETIDPVFGFRTPAQVFFNSPNGIIEGADSGGFVFIPDPDGGTVPGAVGGASILKVNALNLTNRGVMAVGANGFIQVYGQNVDLTSGALIVGDLFDPLSGGGFNNGFPINTNQFVPAPGVYDGGWGIGGNTNSTVQGVIASVNPTDIGTMTPPPRTTNSFGASIGGFRLDEAMTWVREEVIDETNEVVQVIAVQTSDPSLAVFASFIPQTFPPDGPVGGYLTAAIELRVGSTDFSTLARVTNSLYVLDQLGAHTNRDLTLNLRDGTFRPGNFIVHRGQPEIYDGQPASTNIREDLLTVHIAAAGTNVIQQDYLLTGLTNEWSTYPFEVLSVPVRLPGIPGVSLTNLGGQVELKANELKIANTRIRAEGLATLIASNVTAFGSNVVDSPLVSITFGTTKEELMVNEFLPDRVERFTGNAWAYSAIFTNIYETYVTNAPADPADTNIVVVTNNVEVRFQLTLLDARGLQTQVDTVVEDLRLTSLNDRGAIIYDEDLDIGNILELRAHEVVFVEGSAINLGPGVGFSYTNLHDISVITNLGTIEAAELADLRRSENQPYVRFVNHGDISAYGVEIRAEYFENTGAITTTGFGSIDIRAGTLRIDAGLFETAGDIRLIGDVVKLSNLQALAGARLVLDVSQTLADTGVDSPNDVVVFSGFAMSSRRPSGDLLGTTITSIAGTFEFVDHVWAAEDRGPNANGFVNNVALGGLILEGGTNSVFQFLPALENSAIYVDVLGISGTLDDSLGALTNALILGMNVYYADVISTNPAITAQSINRIFGPNAPFNLIWVPDFAGPNSSVDVPLAANGPVSQMNRGLRESLLVDSDGDGIPNGRDAFPLSASAGGERDVQLVGVRHNGAAGSVSFNVAGPAAANYIIERTTNLLSPDWQTVAGVLTNDPATSLKSFTDKIDQGSKQGYYRVRIAP